MGVKYSYFYLMRKMQNLHKMHKFPPKWQADVREQSAEMTFLRGGWLG